MYVRNYTLSSTFGKIHADSFPIQFQRWLKALENGEQLRSLL